MALFGRGVTTGATGPTGDIGRTSEAVLQQDTGRGLMVAKPHCEGDKAKALESGLNIPLTISDRRLVINVGGYRHETQASTLERIPGTRLSILASLQEADEAYDPSTGEFFFDRHPRAFEVILHYYRTEELHVDQGLCGNVLKGELLYWGLEEQEIEPCCWADYSKYTEHRDTLRDLDDNFAFVEEEAWNEKASKFQYVATRVWRFLEEPASSRAAKVYAVTSMFFVGLSISIFVLETHKLFQVDKLSGRAMMDILPEDDTTPTGSATQCCCETEKTNTTGDYVAVTHPALTYLDYVCIVFFTLEFLVRFLFAPKKCKFWKAPLNVIDLVCLLPHYVALILNALPGDHSQTAALFKTVMMLRIVRILRIFKLMKHYSAFKILVYTIKVSTKELLLMVVFLMSGVLMFSSLIHYAEQDNFPNIPIAIWWALVTMTTVGYGDKYPVGYIGYGIGCVCVICGVLVIAFTVPIVVNNFSLYYSHAQTRIKLPNRKKRANMIKNTMMRSLNSTPQSITSNGRERRAFSALPQETARRQIERDKQAREKELNTVKNNLNTEVDDKHTTKIGHVPANARQATPVETSVEDLESIDSGISEEQKQRQYEEETRKVMSNLQETNRKLQDERMRQEQLIHQKRNARARLQQLRVEELQKSESET